MPSLPLLISRLQQEKFLDDWKVAAARPLIKGPNLDTELKNYRPISNLSFLSKITEKAAQSQLQKHFDQQSLFPEHQSDYRPTLLNGNNTVEYVQQHPKKWKIKNVHQLSA